VTRLIKFRAWNDSINEFCYAGPKESDFQGFGILFDWVERWNLPVMQFTGLKDKNGKEIYEGDIISVTNPTLKYIVKYGIEKIQDNEAYGFNTVCGFYLEDTVTIDKYLAKEHMDDMNEIGEVIGNIYENKELLKGGYDE